MKLLELPRLGETMEEGEIVAWLKAPGQAVKRGEIIAEVGTDKVVAELPALEDLVLEEILAPAGTTVKVGQPIARIRTSGDSVAAIQPEPPEQPQAPSPALTRVLSPLDPASGKVRAAPAARRVARELGVDLTTLRGTGPRGRITTEDVRQSKATPSVPQTIHFRTPNELTIQPPLSPPGRKGPGDSGNLHRFTRIEQATAKATAQAKREIPHFYVRLKANLSAFMTWLEGLKSKGHSITINDAIIKATALALQEHPRLNAIWQSEQLRLLREIHIGVITATPEGLVTSVVRQANQLSVEEIALRIRAIRDKAGQLRAEDSSGATFCISNLGMFGVEEFSAIILPPNVAILAVGAVQEEVITSEGAIRIAKTIHFTVSADHRAVDGVEVAKFLQTLKGLLEQPNRL